MDYHAYASEHLNAAQGGIAARSVENYVSRLISVRNGGQNHASGAYYGIRRGIPESAADSFARKIASDDKLPNDAKSTLLKNLSHAQTVGAAASAATNLELAGQIREAFSRVNLFDRNALASSIERYRAGVAPLTGNGD